MKRVLILLIAVSITVSGGLVVKAGSGATSKAKQGERLMNTALLLIDIQNDYFPGGKMVLEGSVQAAANAKRLLTFFRERRMPIVHIQHISLQPGATFFLPETEGIKIQADAAPGPGEKVIQKHYPNSFRDTALLENLEKMGIDNLVICGMMTHMCVDATTRAAFDNGLHCTVVGDACATKSLNFGNQAIPAAYVHGAFLAALGSVYAKIATTDDFIGQQD